MTLSACGNGADPEVTPEDSVTDATEESIVDNISANYKETASVTKTYVEIRSSFGNAVELYDMIARERCLIDSAGRGAQTAKKRCHSFDVLEKNEVGRERIDYVRGLWESGPSIYIN